MSQNKKLNLRDATIDLTFSPARVLLKHRGFMEGEIINIDSDESFEFSNPTPIKSKQIKNNEAQIARNQVSVFLLKFSTVLIWNTYVTVLQHSSAYLPTSTGFTTGVVGENELKGIHIKNMWTFC